MPPVRRRSLADSAAGLRWTAPAGWKIGAGAADARRDLHDSAGVLATPPSAECGVYFFGAGQGGSVEANLDRWKSQFHAPGGKPAAARVARRTAGGLTITTIDTAGEYSGLGGPVAGAPRVVSGYRLLGAIVEGPGGNVFVKFTGPGKTIAANQQKFEQLLTSFQRDK